MSLTSERRYTYAGRVAHLLPYGYLLPYQQALCGFSPDWPGSWLGSGSQNEYDEAERLPTCKRCERVSSS
jgi:hypothetical protein